MTSANVPALALVGDNPVRLWGLTMAERTRRIADANGWRHDDAAPIVLIDARYAADPAWYRYVAANPGFVLTVGAVPAIAHARDADEARQIRLAMEQHRALASSSPDQRLVAFEDGPTIENKQLRKRETPFLMPLRPDTVRGIERASYYGAYKGVTDLLTKYLWPELALILTRICANLGVTPNMVTAIGAALCVGATFAFAYGHYWSGFAMGFAFMVLDTVDGKLARCTITSSWWGNIFDHGIDLVHPPFWWWFWTIGLVYAGLELPDRTFWWVQGTVTVGYLVQRLIEGIFIRRNHGMHIHVWRRFDSAFRLITARRNPNMVILGASLLLSRPDIGIILVAVWTALSCLVHLVRLVQAERVRARSGSLHSWLAEDA